MPGLGRDTACLMAIRMGDMGSPILATAMVWDIRMAGIPGRDYKKDDTRFPGRFNKKRR